MRGGWRILTIRGIPIRLHWSCLFIPLLAFVFFDVREFGVGTGEILAFYPVLLVLVALHELSHAVVAQRYGVRVREILLMPIGGVAAMDRIPEKPSEEAAIAIAGPAFNFVAAVLLFAFIWWLPGITFALDPTQPYLSPEDFTENATVFTRWVVILYKMNLLIGVFNLVPAFPMDGGRLLRAALAATGLTYERATSVAVAIGGVVFALFLVGGVMSGNLVLAAIAVVLWLSASGELAQVRRKSALQHLTVDHLPRNAIAVEPGTSAAEMLHLVLEHPEQRHFPVLDRGRLAGIVCAPELAAALRRPDGYAVRVSALMRPPFVVAPHEALADVVTRLEQAGMPAACVVDDGRVVGLVTREQLRALQHFLAAGGAEG